MCQNGNNEQCRQNAIGSPDGSGLFILQILVTIDGMEHAVERILALGSAACISLFCSRLLAEQNKGTNENCNNNDHQKPEVLTQQIGSVLFKCFRVESLIVALLVIVHGDLIFAKAFINLTHTHVGKLVVVITGKDLLPGGLCIFILAVAIQQCCLADIQGKICGREYGDQSGLTVQNQDIPAVGLHRSGGIKCTGLIGAELLAAKRVQHLSVRVILHNTAGFTVNKCNKSFVINCQVFELDVGNMITETLCFVQHVVALGVQLTHLTGNRLATSADGEHEVLMVDTEADEFNGNGTFDAFVCLVAEDISPEGTPQNFEGHVHIFAAVEAHKLALGIKLHCAIGAVSGQHIQDSAGIDLSLCGAIVELVIDDGSLGLFNKLQGGALCVKDEHFAARGAKTGLTGNDDAAIRMYIDAGAGVQRQLLALFVFRNNDPVE